MTQSDADAPATEPEEKKDEDRRSVLDYVDPVDPILTAVVRHDPPCHGAADVAVEAAAEVKGATLGEAAGSVIKHIVVGIVDNIDF